MNRYTKTDQIHVETGYSAQQLQQCMPSLPEMKPRKWRFNKGKFVMKGQPYDEKVIEFKTSQYFNNIDIDTDESGKPDILFYGPNTGTYHSCAITEANMKRALVKRVLYGGNQRLSDADCYLKRVDAIKFLHEQFLPQFEPLPRILEPEEMFEDYVVNSKQINTAKREMYRKYYADIQNPQYVATVHANDDPKGIRTIGCFQKTENYEEMKEPRAICACSTENKVMFAGIINQLQHYISKKHNFMVKTLTTDQILKRKSEMAQRWSCFCGSDFSSFEGSQDYIWQRYIELPIFEHLMRNYPEILHEFRKCYLNGHEVYYKKRRMFTLFGKRMSGDLHTSLGNSLTNYFIWSYAAYKSGVDMEIMVEGDDAFIASDSCIDINIVKDLGFDCKFQGPSMNPDDILFLSVYSTNGKRFGNITKILDKIGVVKSQHFTDAVFINSNRRMKELNDYIYTKCYCYQVMYKGTPILDPLLDKMMEMYPGKYNPALIDENFRQRMGENIKIPNRPIYPEVREAVSQIWPQFDIEYQLAIEDEIKHSTEPIFRIVY